MRRIKNIQRAKELADFAWIDNGIKHIAKNGFNGSGKTWDAAFVDLAFASRIDELRREESIKDAVLRQIERD